MKRTLKTMFAMAAGMAALVSCSIKDLSESCPVCDAGKELNNVAVGIDASRVAVRGVTGAGDATVSSVKYYVFSKTNGFIDVKDGVGGDLKANFFLPDGTYDFYAIVNAGGLNLPMGAGTKVDDLLAIACRLDDITPTGIIMVGSNKDKQIDRENLSVEISSVRLASKVTFNIDINLNANIGDKEYIFKSVYMTNVQGANNLGLTAYQGVDGVWYNKRGYKSSEIDALLYRDINDRSGNPIKLVNGKGKLVKGDDTSDPTVHNVVFYIFPNDITSDTNKMTEDFTPRHTRFVFEIEFDGKPRYYPTTLPVVVSNKYYIINQEIHTLGYDNPEGDGSLEDMTGTTIKVVDWGNPIIINDVL